MKRALLLIGILLLVLLAAIPAFADDPVLYNNGEPFVVTCSEDTAIDLRPYLGAYVTAYANGQGQVSGIKEVLSEFIEGDIGDLRNDYHLDAAVMVSGYKSFVNSDEEAAPTNYDAVVGNVTLAVKLTGSTVNEIYSMQRWESENTFRLDGAQEEIAYDLKLGGYPFTLDDNDSIDADSFSIVGRNSLSALVDDDIVTVYLHKGGNWAGKIARIEVGTTQIEGVVERINATQTKFTINGIAYELNEFAFISAADLMWLMQDEETALFYLDYEGKIFDFDVKDNSVSAYGVVLATGQVDGTYGDTTYYVKMLKSDGSVEDFTAKRSAVQDMYSNNVGVLVKYTLNENHILIGLAEAYAVGGGSFDANGICNGTVLTSDTVIFSFEGYEPQDADSYVVLSAANLYNADFANMFSIDKNGEFEAVLVSGLSVADNNYAIFVKQNGSNNDGEIWTALYGGNVTSLTLDYGMAPVISTVDAQSLYSLTFNHSGIVTSIVPVTSANQRLADVSDATSVTGLLFRDASASNYSLDSLVQVYVYKDGWTAAEPSGLQGRRGTFESIVLFDTDGDGDYDIALAFKPSSGATYNYAVLLSAGVGTGSNADKGFVTLFMADGNATEFEVVASVSGQITEGAWANTFEPGTLVKYALNSQNVISAMSAGDAADPSGTMQFGTDGSYNGIYMGVSPVVFLYDGTDPSNQANYTVIPRYDLYEAYFTSMEYVAEDGFFQAIKASGLSYPENPDRYAVLLATGYEAGIYGDDIYYAKLFKDDGTVEDFVVKSSAAHNMYWSWPDSCIGVLVKYGTNNNNRITYFEECTETMPGGEFDENGLCNGFALSETAKVFCFDGDFSDRGDESCYSVLAPGELKGSAFTNLIYYSSNGEIKVALVSGLSIRDDQLAIFCSQDATCEDGAIWTALYGGTVCELTMDESIFPAVYASDSLTLYKLTFSRDHIVTSVTAYLANTVTADTSKETSVTDLVFKDGANTMYSLDSAVSVYVYDAEQAEWTVGNKQSLAGKKGTFDSITLIDADADGDYDIALAARPSVPASAGYAILLEKGEDNGVGYARLLLHSGSVATYDIDVSVTGDLEIGSLIGYTLDANGTVVSIDAGYTVASNTPFVFDGAAIYDGVTADRGIVVFSYNGGAAGAASSYTVLGLNGIRNAEFSAMDYLADAGVMKAAKITGLTAGVAAAGTFRLADDVMDEIVGDKALGGYQFVLNGNGEIDPDSFVLLGRSSLSELAEDDIVTVYLYPSGANSNMISKIEVGTTKIEGTITRISTSGEYTINEEEYTLDEYAYCGWMAVSDEGTFYLTYAGKIFDFEPQDDSVSGYAVVLATGSDTDQYGMLTPYIKLFMADGTVAEYAARDYVAGSAYSGGWSNGPTSGELIKYTLNANGIVVNIEVAMYGGSGSFDANGLWNGVALVDKTVVFVYDGDGMDMDDPDNYEIVEPGSLKSSTFDNIMVIDSMGLFRAVLVSGLSVSDSKMAIFTKHTAISAEGQIYTALYGGQVVELTVASGIVPELYADDALTMYSLKFDKSGIVTNIASYLANVLAADVSDATSVNGSVFKDGAAMSYSLDPNVEVYAYSVADDRWTAKGKSILAGRAGAFNYISLIDTDSDGDYDVVLTSMTSHVHDLVKTDAAEATCTEPGNSEYWICSICGKHYSDESALSEIAADSWVIAALGHDYTIDYEWTADNSSVTATAVCARDASHTVTETVNTTAEVTKEPTAGEYGETTYTAVFTNEAFATQTKVIADIEPLPTVSKVGDADGDGKVGMGDRVLLSRYLAGWAGAAEAIPDLSALDINGDGKVNAKDRVILSRYLANWGAEYDQYFDEPFSATKKYAAFVSYDGLSSDGENWTGLFDGKVQEFTLQPGLNPVVSTPTDITLYTLTFANDIVTGMTVENCSMIFADVTANSSVSGDILTVGSINYSLDDIRVYVYDESDDAWTAKAANALGGRPNMFSSIALIDVNSDNCYDIAFVGKP